MADTINGECIMTLAAIRLDRPRECLLVEVDDTANTAFYVRAVRTSTEQRARALAEVIWPDGEVTIKQLDAIADIRKGGTVYETPAAVLAWSGSDPFDGNYEIAQRV
jgi:hypothetical protein